MKRKLLYVIIPIFLIICGIIFYKIQYHSMSFEQLLGTNETNVTKVLMRSGVNGKSVETENRGKIRELINLLNDRHYRKAFNQDIGTGYIYYYDFYSGDKIVLRITGTGNNVHIYNKKRTIDAYYDMSKEITVDSLDNWFNSIDSKSK